MDIREFAEEMKTKLFELLPEVSDIRIERTLKNNSVALTSLIISEEGNNICPTMYLDEYFKQYTMGRCQDSILAEMILAYRKSRLHPMIDISFIRDWEKVKPMIAFKLINTEQNQELLQNIPHKEILDLSMVFYIAVEEVGGTILIYNNHCDMWGIGLEELIKVSEENTPRLRPMLFTPLQEIMSEMLGDAAEEIPEEVKLYILSNQDKVHGAAVMLYPEIMENIAAKLESDLYILPSSTHEVLILPTMGNCVSQLKEMVTEVNNSCVNTEDILGYNVYHYDREAKELSLAS